MLNLLCLPRNDSFDSMKLVQPYLILNHWSTDYTPGWGDGVHWCRDGCFDPDHHPEGLSGLHHAHHRPPDPHCGERRPHPRHGWWRGRRGRKVVQTESAQRCWVVFFCLTGCRVGQSWGAEAEARFSVLHAPERRSHRQLLNRTRAQRTGL